MRVRAAWIQQVVIVIYGTTYVLLEFPSLKRLAKLDNFLVLRESHLLIRFVSTPIILL